jgi:hypothetical protein
MARLTPSIESSAPPGVDGERNYAEFETGNLTLSVFDAERFGLEHRPNPSAMALHVDDVAAARAELEARGVQFAGEILDTGV